MKRDVEKGKTLLVDGPASVSLVSGEAEILGATVRSGERIVIREGKRIPFEVRKKASFDLMLGEDASVEETDGNTIPQSWESASKGILSLKKPVKVMVMGDVDSGKTSFCTYLLNQGLKKGWKEAIIDGDLGQSDIGPPSTIGFSHITAPVKDPFEIEAENAYFVGVTSPSGAVNRVIDGLTAMKNEALESGVEFLVINTDGWINGEDATEYKLQLTRNLDPDVVVGIQQGEELASILTTLKKTKVLKVDSSQAVRRRDREKRKILRELGYKKYLRGAKVQSFLLNWIKVERVQFGTGSPFTEGQIEKIREWLGTSPVYGEESPNAVLVVLKRNQWVGETQIEGIEKVFGKRVQFLREGEEEGLLVGLLDERENFLGIGVLLGVDYKRRAMKVYTPVSKGVSTIVIGQVKLERNGKEIGLSPVFPVP